MVIHYGLHSSTKGDFMKALKVFLVLSPSIFLSGCMGGGGNIDQLVKNPVIQVIIGVIVLWIVFKQSGNKG